MSPVFTSTSWWAIVSTFHMLALVCTSFRLYRRFRHKNTWWDDYWAFFACVLDIAFFISDGIRRKALDNIGISPEELNRRIVLFWLTATLPPLIVWSSRISICLAIARIDIQHTSIRARLWVYALTIAFGVVGSAMLCQKIWICARTTAWHHAESVHCFVGRTIGYISLSGDLTADSLLTIISLRLLWRVRMRRSRHRLLSWLFGANMLSSLVGIVYAVLVFCADANKLGDNRHLVMSVIVNIKTATTLTVCNLLVVITYIYARFWRSSEDSDSDYEESSTSRGHSNLPDGRTTRPSGNRPDTALILTEFDSQGSVISWAQRIAGEVASTLMTWAGSDLVPRAPGSPRQVSAPDSNAKRDDPRPLIA